MNKLLIILIILILFVYLNQYFKVNSEFVIIQIGLSKITPEILFEKSPIIINERVINSYQLLDTIFKYLYIKSSQTISIKDEKYTCYGKYTILQNQEKDCTIDVFHPKKEKHFQKIKLYRNQCMILPMFWKYKSEDVLTITNLCDIFSVIKNLI